ncbi:unnamed protein product [Strongylus vulgaris]|uniref:Uncharacterized protein n=1 Tax=Strongylus vulgaris TaxID=40348 RepID=A0A3P7JFX9_STRVU|nr:unnamed protein product [Strongylus vulgaris]
MDSRDGLPPHRGMGETRDPGCRTAKYSGGLSLRRVSQAEKEFDVSGSSDAQLRVGHASSTTVWLIPSLGGSLIHTRSAVACGESLAGPWQGTAEVWGDFLHLLPVQHLKRLNTSHKELGTNFENHQGSAREEKSTEAGSDCNTSRATGSQYQLQISFARRSSKVQAIKTPGSSTRKEKSKEVPQGPS